MPLNSNNSLNSNHFSEMPFPAYDGLIKLYEGATSYDRCSEEEKASFAALPELSQRELFRGITRELKTELQTLPERLRERIESQLFALSNAINAEQGDKEWSHVEVITCLSTLQHTIQQIALENIESLPEPQMIQAQAERLYAENRAKDHTEARLYTLRRLSWANSEEGKFILEINVVLDAWLAAAEPGENRAKAKAEIDKFFADNNPFQDKNFIYSFTPTSTLSLKNCNLKTLPPIFDRKPFVSELIKLDLQGNQLSTLPSEIRYLQNLRELSLFNNSFTALPEEICELKKLVDLDVRNNHLLSLPANIANLTQLDWLHVNYNPITDYPIEIFNLPPSCHVFLHGACLSSHDRQHIRTQTSLPDYKGPWISGDSNNGSLSHLNEFLKTHFPDPRFLLKNFPDLLFPEKIGNQNKHDLLREWLTRVTWSCDYQTASSRLQTMDRVVEAMQLAQVDPLYREKFWQIVEDAQTNCGDRGALSFLRLGREKKLAGINPQDLQAFAEVLITLWPLEMLDKIAAHQIEKIRKANPGFGEDTQVFLEYPLKLKAKLGLDVEANYFSVYSKVTEEDLNKAEEFVRKFVTNTHEKCRFLLNNSQWFEVFKGKYATDIQKIEEEIDKEMIKLEDNCAAKEEYDSLAKSQKKS